MRSLALCIIVGILAAPASFAQEKKCDPGGEDGIRSLREYDIVALQMRLYMLSQSQPLTPTDEANLGKIAHEAIFALANEFSLYAQQSQTCSLSEIEYFKKSVQANSFVINLQAAIDEETFFNSLDVARWPLKDVPPLTGHLSDNPQMRGRKLPFHRAIESVLVASARIGQRPDGTNPVRVAARELLGQKQDWDVKKFKPMFFELNLDNPLNDPEFFFSHKAEEFQAKPIKERLAILADVYR